MSTSADTPRRRLTAEQRRAAILESSLEVIAARGYHASSIDDIARAAGISKALIYEHFPSKQELYAHLLDQHARELFARIAGALAEVDEPGEPRLATGLHAFFGFVEDHRDAWRMLFREAADPEAAAVLDRIVTEVTGLVATLIAEDPGAHTGPADEAERRQGITVIAEMLVGAVQSSANWWDDHRELPRERLVQMVMDFAWLGLDRLSRGERWTAA